jgi:hypothetical protein
MKNIEVPDIGINVEIGTVTGLLLQFTVPLTITMPCGHSRTFEHIGEIKQSRPCTCGNPDHWFVKWEEIRERVK